MNSKNFDYELLFELSPDLLCIAGFDGYFKKINHAVSELLGYTMEELYASPINDFVYHEDQNVTAKVRKELTELKPLLKFENRYVTKAGEIVWLSWTSLPVARDQLVFAIAKDITDKKKQELARNEMLTNLTKINKELKQLNYTTSHDIRSPISSLVSIIDLLEISKIEDPETIELVALLKESGEQIRKLLEKNIDALSDKHNLHENVEEVDLNENLDSVKRSIHSLIQASNTTIYTNFSKVEKIRFNKAFLESVYLNLITNSIKYAKPGLPPTISIISEKTEGFHQLIVSDNGQGFDMEQVKDKIFGLHQRFHNNNNTDSKGIGLYLVHNHVTSLGGKINVESKLNEGTKFTIYFKAP